MFLFYPKNDLVLPFSIVFHICNIVLTRCGKDLKKYDISGGKLQCQKFENEEE